MTIGIHSKERVLQTTFAEQYAVHRHTIGNWLDQLKRPTDEPLEDVVYDADRSGCPIELTDE